MKKIVQSLHLVYIYIEIRLVDWFLFDLVINVCEELFDRGPAVNV